MALNNEQTPDYYYSISGEGDYYDLQDIMDQLKDDGHEIGDKVTVSRGVKKKFDHSDFFSVDRMIEEMQEQANDEMGEFAGSYLDEMTGIKKGELFNHILNWFSENNVQVGFFGVVDIEEVEIEVK